MKQVLGCLLCVCLVVGCGVAVREQQLAAGGSYEVDILIGQDRAAAVKAVEKIFGTPKNTGFIFENSDYELEYRRYAFTNVSDFFMYFHRGVFVQAALAPVGSQDNPPLRADFQSVTMSEPGAVAGYRIVMDNQEVVLDTIMP